MKPVRLGIACVAAAFAISPPVTAQDTSPPAEGSAAYIDALKQCQSVDTDDQRLKCYDAAVGRVVAATEEGDLTLFNRDEAKETRRNLFGFQIPDLGIFGGDGKDQPEDELFQSTVTSVSLTERKAVTFTIADGGAVWRIGDPPARLRRMKAGDTVEFKPASLGTYFIRVNGRTGVRGRRIR